MFHVEQCLNLKSSRLKLDSGSILELHIAKLSFAECSTWNIIRIKKLIFICSPEMFDLNLLNLLLLFAIVPRGTFVPKLFFHSKKALNRQMFTPWKSLGMYLWYNLAFLNAKLFHVEQLHMLDLNNSQNKIDFEFSNFLAHAIHFFVNNVPRGTLLRLTCSV